MLVELLPLLAGFLDLLLLLVLLLFFVFLDFFDLGLVVFLLFLGLFLFLDFLLGFLGDPEGDGVLDELGVLLDEVLEFSLFEVLELIFLEVEDDLGTTAEGFSGVSLDGEGTSSSRLPDVLFVVVVLGVDFDLVGDQVGRVETNTELSDHTDVSRASLHGFHEALGSGSGDGTEVVDEIGLGHTNTRVDDGQALVVLVGDDVDEQLGLGIELGLVGEGLVTDLVKSVRGVGDKLTKEDLLVRVESVDDQGHQLVDLSLEGECLNVFVGHRCI